MGNSWQNCDDDRDVVKEERRQKRKMGNRRSANERRHVRGGAKTIRDVKPREFIERRGKKGKSPGIYLARRLKRWERGASKSVGREERKIKSEKRLGRGERRQGWEEEYTGPNHWGIQKRKKPLQL